MWKRFWASLTGGRVVFLLDCDGEITRTIARPTGFGSLVARRMIGQKVILEPNGTVSNLSYVDRWEYENLDGK